MIIHELIVKDAQGVAVAWIDSGTGDIHLKGELYQYKKRWLVWNASIPEGSLRTPINGKTVAWINTEDYYCLVLGGTVEAGSLILRGHAVYVDY